MGENKFLRQCAMEFFGFVSTGELTFLGSLVVLVKDCWWLCGLTAGFLSGSVFFVKDILVAL